MRYLRSPEYTKSGRVRYWDDYAFLHHLQSKLYFCIYTFIIQHMIYNVKSFFKKRKTPHLRGPFLIIQMYTDHPCLRKEFSTHLCAMELLLVVMIWE